MIVRPIVCRRFVGREDELAYLNERRREAGMSRGGLVLVSGEAGVGKSRLIAEHCAALAKSRWRVGVGRCLEFAQQPYGPILEVLGRFERGTSALAPAASKVEHFEAIVEGFRRAAARTAIVAVIEDLHWADAATIELLAHLSPQLTALRMLLIVSYRAEEFHAEHPLYANFAKLQRAPGAGRIELKPLSGPELGVFVDEALGELELPHSTRRSIARTSDGNPFFAEELLKCAVESAGNATATATLPATVRATLIERLRPLDERERSVLAHAAVIGRRFQLTLLAATLGVPEQAVIPALRRARELQLIEDQGNGEFRFRHALTREAIYGDFLDVEVRPLHRAIGIVLENASIAATVESLAYHWWAAGDAERTARYNELAGDAAAHVYAHEDAIAAYERGLAAAAPAKRAEILQRLADIQIALGLHQSAYGTFRAAADLYEQLGDREREAACRVRAYHLTYTLGRPETAADLEAMLDRLDPDEYVTRSRINLGIAWMTATYYLPDKTMRHIAQVDPRAIAEFADIRLRYHNIRTWVFMTLGDETAFRAEQTAWVDAAQSIGVVGFRPSAHANIAYCFSVFARHEEALHHVAAALTAAREERNRSAEGSVHTMAAFTHIMSGDLDAAAAALAAAQAAASDNAVSLSNGSAWGALAGAYRGDDAMIAYWFDGVDTSLTPFMASEGGAGYAAILVRRGRDEEARALLRNVAELGERQRGTMFSLLAVARYGDDGDLPRARAVLATIADAPVELPERHALALFDALVARRRHERPVAIAHARSAAEGFRRVRVPLLEAEALELAGETSAALDVYRRCGAWHEVRRLEKPAAAEEAVEPAVSALSPREHEIALLVARGESNAQIARTLSISFKTVEKHLGSIYQKLGFSTNREQLGAHVARAAASAPASAERAKGTCSAR